jgi:hypothetical protein
MSPWPRGRHRPRSLLCLPAENPHQIGLASSQGSAAIKEERELRSGRHGCSQCARSPGERSQDRVDLGVARVVALPVGWLAEVKCGVATLVTKVGIASVFE